MPETAGSSGSDRGRPAGREAVAPRGVTARRAGAVAAAALLALTLPTGLRAQEPPGPDAGSVSVEAVGGLGVPVDELDELTKTGGAVGAGVSIHLTRHVALQARAERHLLEGVADPAGAEFPDMEAVHATGGVAVHLVSPGTRWTGSVALGAGVSHLDSCDSDEGCFPSAVEDFNVTRLSFRGGTKLGYTATDDLTVFLEPAVYLITVERGASQPFADATPEVEPFDVLWLIPVQAGLRLRLF